jgi:hypothetical protein
MPHVDVLYRQIQARQIDTIKVKSAVNVFVNAVGRIQDDIDTISPGDARDFVGREKRWRIELNRIPDAKEVCDRITTEARNRFRSSSHLDAAKLLDCSNFFEYSKKIQRAY